MKRFALCSLTALALTACENPQEPVGTDTPEGPAFHVQVGGQDALSGIGSATIDGILSAGEWDHAGSVDFLANLPSGEGGGTTPATLFVMNDATNLYLAVRAVRSTLGQSSAGFVFENDHDGLIENGDDELILNPSLPFSDNFRTNVPPCPPGLNQAACGFLDTQFGGTTDGQGAATNNGTFTFYEISHPLDSPDDLHDFSLAAGDVVGFFLHLVFCGPECVETSLPGPGFGVFFGDILIASSVLTVDIDIKPGSDPNSINCNNENKTIAVAILTTDDFDATTVDHTTVTFEGATETHVDRKTGVARRHEEDADGDGDTDLVLHFRLGATGLDCGSTDGTLTGETFDGQAIEGADAVRMIDAGGGPA